MTINLDDLSQELGITPSGLRKRIHALGVEVERGSRGRWVIPDDLAATLRDADRLMQDGAGTATVRRILGISVAPPIPDRAPTEDTAPSASPDLGVSEEGPAPDQVVIGEGSVTDRTDVRELADLVAAAVADAVKAENDMGERYARAAHRIGELEERVRGVEADRDRLARELVEARDTIKLLQAPPAQPQRSWWERLLGR